MKFPKLELHEKVGLVVAGSLVIGGLALEGVVIKDRPTTLPVRVEVTPASGYLGAAQEVARIEGLSLSGADLISLGDYSQLVGIANQLVDAAGDNGHNGSPNVTHNISVDLNIPVSRQFENVNSASGFGATVYFQKSQ